MIPRSRIWAVSRPRAAALWLGERGVRFDAAFSSPAERACGTMELLWGGVYQRLEGLRERSFGDLEGTDVLALPKPMGDYPVSFGGEPESKLEARLTSTLAAVMRGDYEARPVSAPKGVLSGQSIGPRNPVPGRTDATVEPCAVRPLDEGAPCSGNVLAVSHGAACKAFAAPGSIPPRWSSPVPSPIAACWCIASTVRRSRWSRSPTGGASGRGGAAHLADTRRGGCLPFDGGLSCRIVRPPVECGQYGKFAMRDIVCMRG